MKLHGWILAFGVALFVLFIVLHRYKSITIDGFDQEESPEAKKYMNAMEQNVAWRNTLQYIQDNPKDSLTYLSTVKNLFFDDKCTFKPKLDFKDLASKYSMVFS
jgi:hypothetical protein